MNSKYSAKFRYLALASVLTILSLGIVRGLAQTSEIPNGIKKGASVEGITEYHLDNGLKVLLFPDNTKQTITVNVTYLVGSKHENYGETGMAHLLEHLVFKGSPKHKNIPQELTSRGAAPNGTTWTDRTNYFETVAATDENLDWALDLEADRMVNSFIAKKDLDSEFSVVRNELESGENSPFRVLFQRSLAVAFDWHNYGKSTIGARSDLENVPIQRLKAFYKRYYQPDNAVLLVAGKFDEAKTLELINKKFGSIPKPTRILRPTYTVEPTQDGERSVTVRRVGDIQMVMAGYHTPPGSHIDAAAVSVMSGILSNVPSGQLYKNLVESKKATAVFSLNFEFKEPSYLMFGVRLKKEDSIEAAGKTLIKTVEEFADSAPSKADVDRIKTQMLKNIDLTLNDPNRLGLGMSEYIAQGDWRLFFIQRDRIKKVTPADVQRVANKYLKTTNRTLARFIPVTTPDRSEVPVVTDDQIATLVKDYKGGAKIAAGEAFDSTPENIEARTTRSEIGGLKVAFLSKENRGDTVFAQMRLRFGDAKSLMNRGTAAQIAGQMLMRGTAKRNRQQIRDEFDRLKARVTVGGGSASATARIETVRQNLPAVLKLVAEILREPAFPESEFDEIKRARVAGLEAQRSEPTNVAINAMRKHFNHYPKGDIRYANSIDESLENLENVTLDQVKAFYKDFYGASNGELAVVGDFDPKQVSALASDLFGNWKSPVKYERVPNKYFDVAATNKSYETPDKANAFFFARLNLKLRDDNPDYIAMLIGNNLLGGGFLNSRLASRIRQKDGLSYGVGSGFQASSQDESGAFFARAIYAPQNVVKLEAAFKEEIQKVISAGFTDKEVSEAIKGMVLARQRRRASDSGLAGTLATYLNLGRTFDWDEKFDAKLNSITTAEVNAAMKKYITLDKISIFKAGDFAKAKVAKK